MIMKTSIWYHTADQQPEKSGYYLGFRTMSLADDSCGVDYFYWNSAEGLWSTGQYGNSYWANVYYWTPDDPKIWVDSDPPVQYRPKHNVSPALEIAWKNVQQAIQQYELIRALSDDSHSN